MIRESISKMKNGKAAGPSGLVSEMVKALGEGVDMNTNLVNHIIVDRGIPAEWERCTIGNRYKVKS